MADGPLKLVSNGVTCPICDHHCKEPRKLPCDHVYCRDCLKSLALNAAISCPECHAIAQVPNNNLDVFKNKNSFHMKSKSMDSSSEQRKKMAERRHSLSNIKEDGTMIWSALSKLSEAETEIAKQEKELQERVDHAFEQIFFGILDKSRKNLKRNIAQKHRFSSDALAAQRENLVALQKENTKLMEVMERSLQNGSGRHSLAQLQSFEKNREQVRDKIKQLTVDTPKSPRHQVKLMSSREFQQFLDKSNSLCADQPMCYIEDGVLQGDEYTVCVHSDGKKLPPGNSEIKAILRCTRDNSVATGKLEMKEDRLKIVFKLQRCGRHELSVTLNRKHVVNSPFSILIHKPPEQVQQCVAVVENLQFPVKMVQFKEKVLVAEIKSGRIVELTSDFKVEDNPFLEGLKGPLGLATDAEMNVYVSTTADHRVHKFASDGKLVRSVGGLGNRPSQFNFPNGLRISKREELYVCDSQNDRIQVFDLNLKFKSSFGTRGSDEGQFHFPSDVDFDSEGNVYVADQLNHRIQVFTRDHHFHTVIEHSPVALCILGDYLYSSSYSRNQVAVFRVSRNKFVKYIGSDVLSCPQGIFFDPDEYMYVTSHDSKIFVF